MTAAETGKNVSNKEPALKYWLTSGLRYILTLAVLGAVVGAVITVTHRYTAPVIAANEEIRLMETLARAVPDADDFRLVTVDGRTVYMGMKNGQLIGLVLPARSKGFYGDMVEMLIMINPAGSIKNVIVQKHKETPGIGSKIKNQSFLSQFNGHGESLLEYSKDEAVLLEAIDTITGATVSSKAVINGVVKAMELYTVFSASMPGQP